MNAHLFQPTAGSKSPCAECGKTRNTKEHKAAKLAAEAQVDTGLTEEEADAVAAEAQIAEEEAVAAARQDLLPEVDAQVDDAEIADALAELEPAQEAEEAPAPVKAAPVRRSKAPAGTVRLWVGWRINNAVVLRKETKAQKSLASKLREAKPNSELDRFVYLTVEELRALDEVGVAFAAEGNKGPVVYSARTMRRRIAEAIAQLESNTTEESK